MNIAELYNEVYTNDRKYKWKYYRSFHRKKHLFENHQEFIKTYFEHGGKGELIENFENIIKDEINNNEQLSEIKEVMNERATHMFGAFFIGIYLIKKIKIFKQLKNNRKDDFAWCWFLCCLYHDAYSSIEKIKRTDIDNELLQRYLHEDLLYASDLIDNYNKYRKANNLYDHGIYAAISICKFFEQFSSCFIEHKNKVFYKNNDYKKIAKIIACHNIFICPKGDKKLRKRYKQFGLDDLIVTDNDNKKMPRNKNYFELLYMLLSICDNLEPTKKHVEKTDVDIEVDESKITIKLSNIKDNHYDEYIKNLVVLDSWLNYIQVDYKREKTQLELVISINEKSTQ